MIESNPNACYLLNTESFVMNSAFQNVWSLVKSFFIKTISVVRDG
jgi:hypothetical protein